MAEGDIVGSGRVTVDTFVLVNVPDIDDDKEGLLIDYLEATLPENVCVVCLTFHPAVPDRVLIELNGKTDFQEVASLLFEQPLEDQVLGVEWAEAMNAVIAVGKELETKLTPFFLKLYFQSEFGDSKEIVTNLVHIPMSSEIAVHFTEDEVTRRILERKTHTPLPITGYDIQVKPFFSNFHGLIPYKGRTFLHILEMPSDNQRLSEDPALQPEIFFDAMEKEPPEADFNEDFEMVSDDEVRETKEKAAGESTEANMSDVNDQTSDTDEDERNIRDNKGFHAQDREMIKKFPSTDYGNGQWERVPLYHNLNEMKSPDDKHLSHDDQNEGTLTTRFQSLSRNASYTDRNVKSPDIAPSVKPEDNPKKKKDGVFSLSLDKAQWHISDEEIRETKEKAAGESTEANMSDVNDHTSDNDEDERHLRGHKDFPSKGKEMIKKPPSTDHGKGQRERRVPLYHNLNEMKSPDDKHLSHDDQNEGTLTTRFQSLSRNASYTDRNVKSPDIAPSVKPEDNPKKKKDGVFSLSLDKAQWHISDEEIRETKEKAAGESTEANMSDVNDHTSDNDEDERHLRGHKDFPSKDKEMIKKPPSTDHGRGQRERRVPLYHNLNEMKSPDDKHLSHDDQNEGTLTTRFQSLSRNASYTDRNVKSPDIAPSVKPEDNPKKKKDGVFSLSLDKAQWHISDEEIRETKEKAAGESTEANMSDVNDHTSDNDEDERHLRGHKDFPSKDNEMIKKPPSTDHGKGQRERRVPLYHNLNEMKSPDDKHLSHDDQNEGTLTTRFQSLSRNASYTDRNVKSPDIAPSVKPEDNPKKKKDGVFSLSLDKAQWHISDEEIRDTKEKAAGESTEANMSDVNDHTSDNDEDERHLRGHKDFPSKDKEMIKKPPSTDHGKGQRERRVPLYHNLNEMKSPDDKHLSHDDQNEGTLTTRFQSLSRNASYTDRNVKSPDIAPSVKPEDNPKKKKDGVFSLSLDKAQWHISDEEIRETKEKAAGESTEANMSDVNDHTSDNDEDERHLRGHKDFPSKDKEMIKKPPSTDHGKGQRERRVPLYHNLNEMKSPDDKHLSHDDQNEGTLTTRFQSLSRNASYTDRNVKSPDIAPSVKPEDNPKKKKDGVFSLSLDKAQWHISDEEIRETKEKAAGESTEANMSDVNDHTSDNDEDERHLRGHKDFPSKDKEMIKKPPSTDHGKGQRERRVPLYHNLNEMKSPDDKHLSHDDQNEGTLTTRFQSLSRNASYTDRNVKSPDIAPSVKPEDNPKKKKDGVFSLSLDKAQWHISDEEIRETKEKAAGESTEANMSDVNDHTSDNDEDERHLRGHKDFPSKDKEMIKKPPSTDHGKGQRERRVPLYHNLNEMKSPDDKHLSHDDQNEGTLTTRFQSLSRNASYTDRNVKSPDIAPSVKPEDNPKKKKDGVFSLSLDKAQWHISDEEIRETKEKAAGESTEANMSDVNDHTSDNDEDERHLRGHKDFPSKDKEMIKKPPSTDHGKGQRERRVPLYHNLNEMKSPDDKHLSHDDQNEGTLTTRFQSLSRNASYTDRNVKSPDIAPSVKPEDNPKKKKDGVFSLSLDKAQWHISDEEIRETKEKAAGESTEANMSDVNDHTSDNDEDERHLRGHKDFPSKDNEMIKKPPSTDHGKGQRERRVPLYHNLNEMKSPDDKHLSHDDQNEGTLTTRFQSLSRNASYTDRNVKSPDIAPSVKPEDNPKKKKDGVFSLSLDKAQWHISDEEIRETKEKAAGESTEANMSDVNDHTSDNDEDERHLRGHKDFPSKDKEMIKKPPSTDHGKGQRERRVPLYHNLNEMKSPDDKHLSHDDQNEGTLTTRFQSLSRNASYTDRNVKSPDIAPSVKPEDNPKKKKDGVFSLSLDKAQWHISDEEIRETKEKAAGESTEANMSDVNDHTSDNDEDERHLRGHKDFPSKDKEMIKKPPSTDHGKGQRERRVPLYHNLNEMKSPDDKHLSHDDQNEGTLTTRFQSLSRNASYTDRNVKSSDIAPSVKPEDNPKKKKDGVFSLSLDKAQWHISDEEIRETKEKAAGESTEANMSDVNDHTSDNDEDERHLRGHKDFPSKDKEMIKKPPSTDHGKGQRERRVPLYHNLNEMKSPDDKHLSHGDQNEGTLTTRFQSLSRNASYTDRNVKSPDIAPSVKPEDNPKKKKDGVFSLSLDKAQWHISDEEIRETKEKAAGESTEANMSDVNDHTSDNDEDERHLRGHKDFPSKDKEMIKKPPSTDHGKGQRERRVPLYHNLNEMKSPDDKHLSHDDQNEGTLTTRFQSLSRNASYTDRNVKSPDIAPSVKPEDNPKKKKDGVFSLSLDKAQWHISDEEIRETKEKAAGESTEANMSDVNDHTSDNDEDERHLRGHKDFPSKDKEMIKKPPSTDHGKGQRERRVPLYHNLNEMKSPDDKHLSHDDQNEGTLTTRFQSLSRNASYTDRNVKSPDIAPSVKPEDNPKKKKDGVFSLSLDKAQWHISDEEIRETKEKAAGESTEANMSDVNDHTSDNDEDERHLRGHKDFPSKDKEMIKKPPSTDHGRGQRERRVPLYHNLNEMKSPDDKHLSHDDQNEGTLTTRFQSLSRNASYTDRNVKSPDIAPSVKPEDNPKKKKDGVFSLSLDKAQWHISDEEIRETKEKAAGESTEANMSDVNDHTSDNDEDERHLRGHKDFPSKDNEMIKKPPSTDHGKGQRERRVPLYHNLNEMKSPDDKHLSHDDQNEGTLTTRFQSLSRNASYTDRNVKSPDIAPSVKPEDNPKKKKDGVFSLSLDKAQWHISDEEIRETKEKAAGESTEANMSDVNDHTSDNDEDERHLRGHKDFPSKDKEMIKKPPSTDHGKGQRERRVPLYHNLNEMKSPDDKHLSHDDQNEGTLTTRFQSLSRNASYTDRNVKSPDIAPSVKPEDNPKKKKDGVFSLSLDKAQWHISDEEIRETKEKAAGESTEANMSDVNDHTSDNDEDERHLRGHKDFPSKDKEMIKKPPSTDHGKGQRERRVPLYHNLNEMKSPDDKHLSHDDQNEGTLTTRFQSLSRNASYTDRNVKSPDIAPSVKPEDNPKKKKDRVFSLSLDKAQWRLMRNKIKRESNEMDYDEEKETLSVRGQNVDQFMKSFTELIGRVKECHIPLDEDQQLFLKSEYAKTYLTLGLHDIEWIIERDHLDIYGLSEFCVNRLKDKVNEMIGDIERTTIPNNVSDEDLKQLKSHFEILFPVHISSDDLSNSITIIGRKNCGSTVKKELESKSKGRSQQEQRRDFKESSVQFSLTHYSLLMNYYTHELDAVLKNVRYKWREGTGGKVFIDFNGRIGDVLKVEDALTTVQGTIKTEEIDVSAEFDSAKSLHLIQRLSSLGGYDPIFAVQKSFEVEHKCIINNVVKKATSPQATSSTQHHGRVPKKSYAGPVSHENQQSSFQVNSSIQLEIKSYGDIVKEQSDILVCVLPEYKKLSSTFVGQAFCKALPGLEFKVHGLDFSYNKVAFMASNLPRSQCGYLAFVILPVYPDIPSLWKNVELFFRKSVVEVLHGASQFGAHSVCFPPLGHGKMMKYPESFISEHFLSALKYYSDTCDSRLRKITFLTPDKDLYKRMTSDAPAYFASMPKAGNSRGYDDIFAIQEKNVLIQIIHRNSFDVAPMWKSKLERLTKEEIVKEGKGRPQRPLPTVPSRGTVAFMKYIAPLDVTVPSYWENKDGAQSSLHNVKDRTRQSIEKLLLATWDSAKVGLGKDAKGIPRNSKIEFVSLQRIESPATFNVYATYRKGVLQRKIQEGKVCESIKEISSNRQPVLTSANLPDFMEQELCGEINEHYLFHGTKQESVDPIINQGCYPNLSSPTAMFGKGVYAAESFTKADQYTDDPQNRLPSGSIHTMFLVRMLLGDVFRCTKQHPSISRRDADKLVRPPCKKCHKDRCLCGDNYDSVMGEDGWIFREFVVYQHCHCYPEYLIKYKRV